MVDKGQSCYLELNDRTWLYQKYRIEELTIVQIARIIGCHRDTVSSALKHQNIPKRKLDFGGDKNPHWKGGKVKRVCVECGEVFFVKRYNVKANFCSISCYAKWQSKNNRGEKHPAWKGGGVKKICKNCGREFRAIQAEKERAIFCSKTCKDEYQKTDLKGAGNPNWKGGKIEITCDYCGKSYLVIRCLEKQSRFCSRSCMSNFYRKNKKPRRRRTTRPTGIERIFRDIVEKNALPYRYTGDGSFWIHNMNPDFVECNGKKIVVEVFGGYWHSPLLNRKVKENRTLPYRKKALKRYGWKLIVFWEADLLREDAEAFVLITLKKAGVI